MMDIRFTNDPHPARFDEILAYLRGPRLWMPHAHYPDFEDWLQRAHGELRSEQKRAIVALERGVVVGAVIYQRDKQDRNALELKNITVRPDQRGRHVASFLVRNCEIEGARDFPGTRRIRCDAKRGNAPIRLFFLRNGYRIAGSADLYGLGAGEDLLFEKALQAA